MMLPPLFETLLRFYTNDKESTMDQNILQKAQEWLNPIYDEQTRREVQALINKNDSSLIDSFYRDLEFGTGGLRGKMGVGSNRMNIYTVAKATQGLANYLKKQVKGPIKVALTYDSRLNNTTFANITADVLSANDIQVYLSTELRPTPWLSFAVRHLNCHSGIVITASHNPKEYNGYKVYWSDGAQVVPPHDENIIDEVLAIPDFSKVLTKRVPQNIISIGKETDEAYLKEIKALSINPEIIKKNSNLNILYTPIHGAGITCVPQSLKNYGFTNVTILESQSIPDGNFPTVAKPNPEEKETMAPAIAEAKRISADLVLATDPDADRVGVAIKDATGEYFLLNGNQTGAILVYYLLSAWKQAGKLKGKEYVVKTIVTTELIKEIATHFNVESFDVLTGFKYIAAKIKENEGIKQFIGGGEESYGYLAGEFVRDKDAVIACSLIAEMTAWAKDQGHTLFDILLDIYSRFGLYLEDLVSVTKEGKSGSEEIDKLMNGFRANPPKSIAGSPVIKIVDYETKQSKDIKTSKITSIDLPASNVLQFFLEDGTKVTARPSGTEPKIKYYVGVKKALASKEKYVETQKELATKIKTVFDAMVAG